MKIHNFKEGTILQSGQLNELYEAIIHVAKKAGLDITPKHVWTRGAVLTAPTLNDMLNDLETVYQHLKLSPPQWTFGRFRNGQVLKAAHLNEIVKSTNHLLNRELS